MKKLNKKMYMLEDRLKAVEYRIEQNERGIRHHLSEITTNLSALYEFFDIKLDPFNRPQLTVKLKDDVSRENLKSS